MEQKNLILAIVLSVAVLLGWEYFVVAPRNHQQMLAQQQVAEQAAKQATATSGATALPSEPVAPKLDRPAALAQSPRITIDSARLKGSIALKGGRLDDLALKDYRETIDRDSPSVTLLSPFGAPDAYYADFGWTSGDSKIALPGADTLWQADGTTLGTGKNVTLSWDNGQGLVFKRVFAIDDNYMFTVTQTVANKSGAAVDLQPYARVKRFGTPMHASQTYVLHEGMIGELGGAVRDPSYSDVRKQAQDPANGILKYNSTGGWAGITDKNWLVAQIADNAEPITGEYFYDTKADSYQADYVGKARNIAPGSDATVTQRLFAGAKEVNLLRAYRDNQAIGNFDLAIDFGWYWFFTKPLMLLLDWLYKTVGNFGIAIMILTICVKSLMFPLANKSYKSMNRMKQLTPQIQAMKEQFGDDKTKLNQEMMALYKREKVNPAAGCLPIFVQIPVFFSLYKVFYVTIEMRQAPFFGWIHDLSVPDPTSWMNLFGLLPYDVSHLTALPVIGGIVHTLSIGIWPLIMGCTMWLQQRLNPTPPDPVQAKMMTAMPIVFTFMLGSMPAGLVIYWAWNNSLSILQQKYLMWRMNKLVPASAKA
ncbi:MAG TPA: membrane protein insertase YidC [Dongiaceae bacterium]